MPETTPALASVSVDRIANAFIAWAESEPGRYWWWPRDIRLDPDEVIADDGEGNTYRVPFQTDGELDVTFGDPVEVRETFVDVAAPAAAAAAATARVRQRVLARDLPKPDKRTPSNDPAASAATTEEAIVPDLDLARQRQRLGLPDDTPDEQVIEALNAETPPDPAPSPEPPPAPEGEPTPASEPEPGTTPAPEPAAAEADPIAATQARALQETTQRVAQLEAQARQREETETRQRRDGLASQWVTEGRIAPSEREHYRQLLDVSEERTVALASSLAAGRIPVRERGHDHDPAATSDGGVTATGWFPQLKEA